MRTLAVDATALLGPRTGIGTFVAELLDHLGADDELDVLAFAATWRGRGGLADQVPPGVRTLDRPLPARPLRAAWARSDHPTVEALVGDVDVVHGPNYVVPPARRAARIASVHDLTFLHHPEMSTRDTLAYGPLLRRAVAGGAWIHVDADAIGREVVAELGAPPERVVTVPLAPSPVPDADPARGRQLAGAERYVVALGTVEPRKDLPGLVAAFDAVADAVDDVRLVVAGPDGWGTAALHDALDASGHRDRIVRLGWVDGADRAALLRGAAVLAYPSLYEGFGLPPLEAMSVGTPVVATAVGSLPEVCGDGAELVPAGDLDALAGALVRTLDDDGWRARLVARGRANVARFSWEATARGLVALYRRAAEG